MDQDQEILAEFQRFRALTSNPGWDDETANKIEDATWDRAIGVFSLLKERNFLGLTNPFISPCGDGTVFISWTVSSDPKKLIPSKEAIFEITDSKIYLSTIDGIDFMHMQEYASVEDLQKLTREQLC